MQLLLFTENEGSTPLAPYSRIATEIYMKERSSPELYSQGVAGTATANGTPYILSIEDGHPSARLQSLRDTLSRRIRSGLSGDGASFFCALFLGDRSALPDEVTASFRRTGTTHLLALSGLHLSVLALFWLRILRVLGAPNSISFPLLLLFLLAYTGISGFPLSLVRAAFMLAFYRLAILFRLFSDSFTSLSFAVALILLISPASATDIGLHLSFLATLGILVVGEMLNSLPRKRRKLSRLLHALLASVLTSLFAILFTLLLSVLTFGKVSLIAIPANLLLSPLVSLSLVLSPILLLFPSTVGPVADVISRITLRLASRLSGIRGCYAIATYPLFLLALSLFSLYLIFLLVGKLRTRKGFFLRFSIALTALLLVFLGCHTYTKAQDVLLYTRNFQQEYLTVRSDGRVTVIANTLSGSSVSVLKKALDDAYVNEVDVLILTHYEDGVAEFLESANKLLAPRKLLLPPPTEESTLFYREALLAAEYLSIPTEAPSSRSLECNGIKILLEQRSNGDGSTHEGILIAIDHPASRIRYASPNALSLLEEDERQLFLADADLMIFGAHPSAGEREPSIALPEDCILFSAYPTKLPDGVTVTEEALVEGVSDFSYPLRKK